MTRDDLNELRMVNPVAEEAAAELVAGTAPELLAELGRTTALPHGESVRPAAVEVDPGWARPQGRRPARANVLAVAAVTLAVLAVPVVALLMSGQSSDDTTQVPADRVPTPSDLAPPDPTTLEAEDAAAPPTTRFPRSGRRRRSLRCRLRRSQHRIPRRRSPRPRRSWCRRRRPLVRARQAPRRRPRRRARRPPRRRPNRRLRPPRVRRPRRSRWRSAT